MGLNGVFVMLSFLAQTPLNFRLPGSCPRPPRSSLLSPVADDRLSRFYTALHYNSEQGDQMFGSRYAEEQLNCLQLDLEMLPQGQIALQDCGYYTGKLATPDMVAETSYNVTLTNADPVSTCLNQTTEMRNLSIWTDTRRDFVILWSCMEHPTGSSHKQTVVVLVSSDMVAVDWNGNLPDKNIHQRMVNFTEETLAFSRLNVSNFDVNHKLLVTHNLGCELFNCSAQCSQEAKGEESSQGPILFFILACFVVLIVFVAVM